MNVKYEIYIDLVITRWVNPASSSRFRKGFLQSKYS